VAAGCSVGTDTTAAAAGGRRWSKNEKMRELLERNANRRPTAHGDQRSFSFKYGIALFKVAAKLSAAKRNPAMKPN